LAVENQKEHLTFLHYLHIITCYKYLYKHAIDSDVYTIASSSKEQVSSPYIDKYRHAFATN